MSVVAVYNMKGGVGKTTTAVNLSYLAAAAGQRTLLWDLDPQAASSFAFRIRPRVAGFGRKSLEGGQALAEAIKETDYTNLDLLPADFTFRRLDRLLGHFGKPERVVTALLTALGRDYDVVLLDCPAGFSLLTQGIFAAADGVLVPSIPTVLSLRMVARLVKWADRSDSPVELAAFFSMVDRRKTLHRQAREWSTSHPDVFLAGHIPYASVVEQMTVRRMPLAEFAPRDAATSAFAEIWAELQTRLHQRGTRPRQRNRWERPLLAIESLIARLEWADPDEAASRQAPALHADVRGHRADQDSHSAAEERDSAVPSASTTRSPGGGDVHFVHRFDTASRDLQRGGYILELHEHSGEWRVVVARCGCGDDQADTTPRATAQIDSTWAVQILSGVMSPLTALERRLSRPLALLDTVCAIVDGHRIQRIDSRVAGEPGHREIALDSPPCHGVLAERQTAQPKVCEPRSHR